MMLQVSVLIHIGSVVVHLLQSNNYKYNMLARSPSSDLRDTQQEALQMQRDSTIQNHRHL